MMEKSNVAITGTNAIGDAYFIRLKDNTNYFVHPDPSLETKEDMVYKIIEGPKGAAIFKNEQADNFIVLSNADNLEKVNVKKVLGNDNSSMN